MKIWTKRSHNLLASILAAFLVWPVLASPTVPRAASDFAPPADSLTHNDLSASASAPMIALTLTPSPTAVSSPTPTPQPNHYIWIPWRSQFDGTPYQSGNCGPASLGMAMAYYGEWWSTDGIRKSTIERSGPVAFDEGTDWPSLAYAAEKRNFVVVGLYNSTGAYRNWTIEDLMHEIEQKHPVLLLVSLRALPGHTGTAYEGDHYIVFLGLMADGRVVYHDPDFFDERNGSYRIMSQETLLKAWGNTSVGLENTAMSLVWKGASRKWDDPAAAGANP